MYDWPWLIAIPVEAFLNTPLWLRVTVGVAVIAALGKWLL